ncbi:hypothetical protein JCM3770_000628 [Rhodotorula araucariae]
MLRSLILSAVLATTLVSAHIELMFPPPINSKYDPQTIEANKDYSMTSPLLPDGSNFPCKGYNTPSAYNSLNPVATLQAGQAFEIEFAAGGATHGGGSCQFSVSYDQGKTFAVIHSVIGGCPLQSSYNVPIPANLPSATGATFAWTWFNLLGNREMYMNCAIVDIKGSSAKSYTGPGLYRANTLGDGSYGTCVTAEGAAPVFPNPGSSVEYAAGMSKSSGPTVLDGCSYNEDTTVTISPAGSAPAGVGSGSGSSASKTTTSAAAPTTSKAATTTSKAPVITSKAPVTTSKAPVTTSKAPVTTSKAPVTTSKVPVTTSKAPVTTSKAPVTTSKAAATTTKPVVTTTSKAAATTSKAAVTTSKAAATTSKAVTTSPASSTTARTVLPGREPFATRQSSAAAASSSRAAATSSAAPAKTSSASRASTTTRAQSTTAATPSKTTVTAAPAATTPASPSGGSSSNSAAWLTCTSSTTFSLCDANGCTPMGSVAPGTVCIRGAIEMAPSSRERMARLVKRSPGSPAVDASAEAALERPSAHMSAKIRRRAPGGAARIARAHVVRSSRSNGH